ncbi:hypothetical protein L4C34_07980 [Vibrio profundum]|uniref:hypothetical protein n=1 Tax=Vibrio profundum TaxID=2910247 RepID=UPI003D122D71
MSSQGSDNLPWVILQDCRQWEITSLDAWSTANDIINWMLEHNCIYVAFVFSIKLQQFAFDSEVHNASNLHFHFDYKEAYQACLDTLEKSQTRKIK